MQVDGHGNEAGEKFFRNAVRGGKDQFWNPQVAAYLDPFQETVAVFADGGVISRNPSTIGGTVAFCLVNAQDEMILSASAVLLPGALTGYVPETGEAQVTNNVTEYAAVTLALTMMEYQWSGTVYSDSGVTLGRMFHGWALSGLPFEWIATFENTRARLGKMTPVLLDGHPTKAQLAAGIGKRGNPCHSFNVFCDGECTRQAKLYLDYLASLRNEAQPQAVVEVKKPTRRIRIKDDEPEGVLK